MPRGWTSVKGGASRARALPRARVDAARGALALGDRLDQRAGAERDVAAREHARRRSSRASRGRSERTRPASGGAPACSRAGPRRLPGRPPAAPRRTRSSRPRGAVEGRVAARLVAQAHDLGELDAHHAALVADDAPQPAQRVEDHPLGLGLHDLLAPVDALLRGPLAERLARDDVHLGRAALTAVRRRSEGSEGPSVPAASESRTGRPRDASRGASSARRRARRCRRRRRRRGPPPSRDTPLWTLIRKSIARTTPSRLLAVHLEVAPAPGPGPEEDRLVAVLRRACRGRCPARTPSSCAPRRPGRGSSRSRVQHGAGRRCSGMPWRIIPPSFEDDSKTVTLWPSAARSCAQARPEGPPPTTATRRPVTVPAPSFSQVVGVRGPLHAGRAVARRRPRRGCRRRSRRRRFSVRKRLSGRIATGSSIAPRRQASSQGAAHTRAHTDANGFGPRAAR